MDTLPRRGLATVVSWPILWENKVRSSLFQTGCFFFNGPTPRYVRPGLRRELKVLQHSNKLKQHGGSTVPYCIVHFSILSPKTRDRTDGAVAQGTQDVHGLVREIFETRASLVVEAPNFTRLAVPCPIVPFTWISWGGPQYRTVPYRTAIRPTEKPQYQRDFSLKLPKTHHKTCTHLIGGWIRGTRPTKGLGYVPFPNKPGPHHHIPMGQSVPYR